ncbi:MAG: serine--tRNA ligase, partial [Dehalococcoidia bacterium]|nr:serine--tRNA ligase [Dehalococcoidia bacterium]
MLSLQMIRDNTDLVRDALTKRGETTAILDQVIKLDEQRRRVVHDMEVLRAELKKTSKVIGQLMGEAGRQAPGSDPDAAQKKLEEAERLKTEMRGVSSRIAATEAEIKEVEERQNDLMLRIPNIPDSSVPPGKDDSGNLDIRIWGVQRQFDFTPKPHWELGTALGIIDFDRGAKLSGSRFYVLMGLGARLQRALIAFML